MKIRPSIRLYFVIVMLITGVGSIGVMTVTAINYLFSGMDIAMTGFMRSQALEVPLGDNEQPVQIDQMTIAAHWHDLPQVIQDHLNQEELIPNQLIKNIDGIPVLSPPDFGYFAMKVETADKVRYVALSLAELDGGRDAFHRDVPPFLYIILTGLVAIVFFAIVLVLVQRNISTPVERLKDWAKGLDKDQLTQPTPNFHYSELNSLAELVRSSLSSVQESLEREQRFLGYASHELRTPIAVTRTNAELLRKMIVKGLSAEKQLAVLDRIERAGFTMTDLTETLLWLNRKEGKSLPSEILKLGHLTQQIESELHYLLQGKCVEVTVRVDDTELDLPSGLCRIVLGNLIRNAFQHTQHGEVEITQSGRCISIINRNTEGHSDQDDLGFGIGLELTQRLIHQYGWSYTTIPNEHGMRVEVSFE
ncbi:sensor histidine kinase [Vibrio hippocampi]|uniref:histidine kinase n=1 Tax=Vibrio hippocampi TaxID=654686 RepID=A0ABM8ZL63_9VIBR|nr:HAMP domain-containing sensor histidine kinase [Vibrio hippocampi]CAH0528756.1 Adaptive-response sensory-kinase SasA [Vibrio hippocampi]